MAKLVDLLAKYLVEWPDGAEYARQDYDKEICFLGECSIDKDFFISEMAEDVVLYGAVGTTKVYMKDWLAARDRLHAETVKDMREPTNADTDQALWDKVASNAIPSFLQTSEEWTSDEETSEPMKSWSDIAKGAAQLADAFMAERAKRLKGGV